MKVRSDKNKMARGWPMEKNKTNKNKKFALVGGVSCWTPLLRSLWSAKDLRHYRRHSKKEDAHHTCIFEDPSTAEQNQQHQMHGKVAAGFSLVFMSREWTPVYPNLNRIPLPAPLSPHPTPWQSKWLLLWWQACTNAHLTGVSTQLSIQWEYGLTA